MFMSGAFLYFDLSRAHGCHFILNLNNFHNKISFMRSGPDLEIDPIVPSCWGEALKYSQKINFFIFSLYSSSSS